MPQAVDPQQFLDPKILAQVSSLELQARLVVDGYLSGMHRSPYHGFAVEFAQHREYVPGDDIRHIDWKVYGRTGRYYLKQYEQDTNLVCWLFVDASESMSYGSGPMTKHTYASIAAASLAYLILNQSDSMGLATFDTNVRQFLRPSGQQSHLKEIIQALSQGPGSGQTRLGGILHELADRVSRRGLIVLFSDLLDEVADTLAGLRHLRYLRHDVVVFHVMDAAEMDFPFQDATLFRGLEQLPELLTDPRSLRESYLEELGKFLDELKRGCRNQNIDYVPLRTDQNLGTMLAAYLAWRAGRQ
jgi:uncharacterized protein (DUF58 family)